jgi:hypothetical protein
VTRAYRPVAAAQLADLLAQRLAAAPVPGRALRVAIDGPRCATPVDFAAQLVAPLRALGRPVTLIPADSFWRDAALRLEHGHEDALSLPTWLDAAALRREVLDPLGPGGAGAYLPSLRDPRTNRATRESARQAAMSEIVVVAGELLLGRELPFDVTIHLVLSSGARARGTDPSDAWTLPAWDDYDREIRPAEIADIAIRYDDATRPAVG